jgi:mannosyltransferase
LPYPALWPPGSAAWLAALPGVVVAAVLGFRRLGAKPLWLDETVSVSVATRPWPRILEVLAHHDANAGLYYLLLHVWLHLGHGVTWDRVPTVVFFVATAGVAAVVATRWRGAWLGVACGLLVATNKFLLFYGQEARPYALAVLLAVVSTAALFARDGEPSPVWYVAATTALLYADLFAVLFVAVQAAVLVVLTWSRRRRMSPVLVRCWLAIGGAAAPLALVMVSRERAQISWLTRPTVAQLGTTYSEMANGPLGLLVITVLAVLALRWALEGRRRVWEMNLIPVLLGAAAVPPVVLWVFARAVPSFLDRYVICSTVAVVGLAAVGLEELRRVAGAAAAVVVGVVLLGLGGVQIVTYEAQPYKYENLPAVVGFISAHARPGDVMGFDGGGLRTAVDAYLPAPASGSPGAASFPTDIALAPGGEAFLQHDLYAREVTAPVLLARLQGVHRVWMVIDPSSGPFPTIGPFTAIRRQFLREYAALQTWSFPGVEVTLFNQSAPNG